VVALHPMDARRSLRVLGVVLCGAGAWLASTAVTARAAFERGMQQQDEDARESAWVLVDAAPSRRDLVDQPWRELDLWWHDTLPDWLRTIHHEAGTQTAVLDNLIFRRSRYTDLLPPSRAGFRVVVASTDHMILGCVGGSPGGDNPMAFRQSRDLRRIEFRCQHNFWQGGPVDYPMAAVAFGPLAEDVRSPGSAARARRRALLARFDRAVRVSGGLLGALALGVLWAEARTRRRRVLGPSGALPMPYRAAWEGPRGPAAHRVCTGPRLHVGLGLLCVLACGWVAWERHTLQQEPPPTRRFPSPSEPSALSLHAP